MLVCSRNECSVLRIRAMICALEEQFIAVVRICVVAIRILPSRVSIVLIMNELGIRDLVDDIFCQ